MKDLDVNSIEGFTTWPPCLASSNRPRMSVPRPLHRTGPNGREDNPTPDSCKPELEDFRGGSEFFFAMFAKLLVIGEVGGIAQVLDQG